MKRSDVKGAIKKREKEPETKKPDSNADYDLFIQTYEKPTLIYKFLRIRFKHSPYFLHRNLWYMPAKRRKCKSTSSRRKFSFDDLNHKLDVLRKNTNSITKHKFLSIKYLGFLTKDGNNESVTVETLLMKLGNKKRKESTCPVMTKSFGTRTIPSNPLENQSPKSSGVTIPADSLSLTNGHSVKSYHLLMRVTFSIPNGLVNRESELNGPNAKKRKVSNGKDEKSYVANLTVYDKRNRCLLPDGEYQLLMHEWTQNSPSKVSHVNTSWETIPELDESEMSPAFENFSIGPKLKLRLSWTDNEDDDTSTVLSVAKETNDEEISSNISNSSSNKENNNPENNGIVKVKPGHKEVVYQFLYSNNSRQSTEPVRHFRCHWCSELDCNNLISLLKHLRVCHARFTFTLTDIPPSRSRIDVALNEKYDGSYIGPSRDVASANKGFSISKRAPIRRAPVSKVLFYHPKRLKRSFIGLQEFYSVKDDNDGVDISGHNRMYHHTSTCLPLYPKEMDMDSENESDPKWLQKKTTMMIDDFTDVNDGEKELMKMWNLHVMKHGFVGDCQIPLACTLFLETRGQELLKKNLYRNFVLHMCNLFDFGLISAVTVYTTIQRLQELIGEGTEISTLLRESWKLQRTNWLKTDGTHCVINKEEA